MTIDHNANDFVKLALVQTYFSYDMFYLYLP